VLAALALREREAVREAFRGVKKMRSGKAINEGDWVIAFMPSTYVRLVARLLARRYGEEVLMYTDIALNLHEYQYNGPNREGIFSRYPSAAEDIKRLIRGIGEFTNRLAQRGG
jgi:hypothetical protein